MYDTDTGQTDKDILRQTGTTNINKNVGTHLEIRIINITCLQTVQVLSVFPQ